MSQAPHPPGYFQNNIPYETNPSSSNGPMRPSPQETVREWQNNQYFPLDSGIHSGISTNAPSVYSGVSTPFAQADEMMEHDQRPVPPPPSYEMHQRYLNQEYTQEQYEDIGNQYQSTRTARVRAAMFPETMESGTEYPTTELLGQPTAVGHLAEPAQLLKQGVHDLVQFQSNADIAVRIIPELVKLLQDEDKEVVAKTARFIHQLSKNDASRGALCQDATVVTALVQSMNTYSGTDPEMAHCSAGILYQLSCYPEGLSVIFRSYGIPFLISLLGHPSPAVRRYALTTLHNLIEHLPNAKLEVFNCGGIKKMVPLLKIAIDDTKFVTVVCDCIKHMTLGNSEAKVQIGAVQGPIYLLECLKKDYEKLIYAALSVLKPVSVEDYNKEMILKNNGINVLVWCAERAFQFDSPRVIQSVLYVVRNLSDMLVNRPEFRENNVDNLLKLLVRVLNEDQRHPNWRRPHARDHVDPLVLCAAGTLSNLTCNNQQNKIKVCELDGIPRLLEACRRYPTREEVTEPAICTLRHITGRHQYAARMQEAIVWNFNGIEVILEIIRASQNKQYPNDKKPPGLPWTLKKALVGFIHHIASVENNRAELRERSILKHVIEFFLEAIFIIERAAANRIPPTGVLVDNVKMHDVLESALGAMSQLSKNVENRIYIRNYHVDNVVLLPILIGLLNFPVENVLRFLTCLLSELTKDPEGSQLVEQNGAIPGLTALLQRPRPGGQGPDAIAQYAANAIYQMSQLRSPEYRQQVQLELQQIVGQPLDSGNLYSVAADYDYLLQDDSFRPFMSSGPPSVHGSVHGTNLSVYNPESVMSDMDMGPYQQPYSQPDIYNIPTDNQSWRDSDV